MSALEHSEETIAKANALKDEGNKFLAGKLFCSNNCF